jgi:hypothetical protein
MPGEIVERESTPWITGYAPWLPPGCEALDLGCGLGHDTRDLTALG